MAEHWIGDARSLPWPDGSVQCVVTSPPYWGQRDYGHPDQIGMEPTWVEYVDHLRAVGSQIRRVLRDDGTLWLNLGDTYNTRAIIRPSSHQGGLGHDTESTRLSWAQARDRGLVRYSARQPGLKDKDMMSLPHRVAQALVDDGWWLRAEVIWTKPWCAPSNQMDIPRRMHESIFLLAKSRRYRYDRSAEPVSGSVWEIPPAAAPDGSDHEAVFPDELVRRCLAPTTQPEDVVADPFGGAGTTARVAEAMGRTGWSLDLRDWSSGRALEETRG